MSLSSLGAQLASLHSTASSKNPGSVQVASKRKEDAIGRGVQHSTQHGHVLQKHKFKPSILYNTTGSKNNANDVPLATLQENALTCLNQLIQTTRQNPIRKQNPHQQSFQPENGLEQYVPLMLASTLSTERHLMTQSENQALDQQISGLLVWISVMMQETSSTSPTSCFAHCLHVLEYCIRRYEIHIRNTIDLLLCMMPHYQLDHGRVLGRVLQLVNLVGTTETTQMFTFLRRYAATTIPVADKTHNNNNNNNNHGLLSRTVLAKAVSHDLALMKLICQYMVSISKTTTTTTTTTATTATTVGRGCHVVTSVYTAIVVEALTMQSKTTGTLNEATVRVVMPFVLQGCSHKRPMYTTTTSTTTTTTTTPPIVGFAYIVASTMAEHVLWSSTVLEKLCNSILQGCTTTTTKSKSKTTTIALDETALTLLMAILPKKKTTLLMNMTTTTTTTSYNNNKYDNKNHKNQTYTCNDIPRSTFHTLLSMKAHDDDDDDDATTTTKTFSLVSLLGQLYTEAELHITPFVVCLLDMALMQFMTESSEKQQQQNVVDWIQELLTEPLLESWWKESSSLVSSLVMAVLQPVITMTTTTTTKSTTVATPTSTTTTPNKDDDKKKNNKKKKKHMEESSKEMQPLVWIQSLLQALRKCHTTAYEKGVADFVHLHRTSNKDVKQRLAKALGLPMTNHTNDNDNDDDDAIMQGTDSTNDHDAVIADALLLPPRIALEHANASVRKTAMEQLVTSLTSSVSSTKKVLEHNTRDETCSVLEALLNHFLIEEELDMIMAAGHAVEKVLLLLQHGSNHKKDVTKPISDTVKHTLVKIITQHQPYYELLQQAIVNWSSKSKYVDALVLALDNAGLFLALTLSQQKNGLVVNDRDDNDDDDDDDDDNDDEHTTMNSATTILETQKLMVLLLSHWTHDVSHVSMACAKAICVAFSESPKKSTETHACKVAMTHATTLLEACHTLSTSTGGVNSNWKIMISTSRAAMIHMMSAVAASDIMKTGSKKSKALPVHVTTTVSNVVSHLIPLITTTTTNRTTTTTTTTDVPWSSEAIKDFMKCIEVASHHTPTNKLIAMIGSMATSDAESHVTIPASKLMAKCIAEQHEERGISQLHPLFEAALCESLPSSAVLQLIKTIGDLIKTETSITTVMECIVPILALVGHNDYAVRKAVVDICTDIHGLDKAGKTSSLLATISTTSDQNNLSSTILMDGVSSLPSVLRHSSKLSKSLLEQCVKIGTANWLPPGTAAGSMYAASTVLNAVELAGETCFSLTDRWTIAGSKLLQHLRSLPASTDLGHCGPLIDSVIRMLKGAVIHDSADLVSTIISSGPGKRGTRSRSYSVGRASGVSFIESYPNEMLAAISTCLSVNDDSNVITSEVCRTMIREVLSSESWCKSVFTKLSQAQRVSISNGLLQASSTSIGDVTLATFLHLPLDPSDISKLLDSNKSNLDTIALVMDHIRSNAETLVSSKVIANLTSSLLEILEQISTSDLMHDHDNGIEFVQHATLNALVSLVNIRDAKHTVVKKTGLSLHTKLLVHLVGASTDASSGKKLFHRLGSWKARKTALALISSLCSLYPAIVVKDMVEAIMACISSESVNDTESLRTTLSSIRDLLFSIVPVFYKYSKEAKLTLFDLLDSFMNEVDKMVNLDAVHHIRESMTLALVETEDEKALVTYFALLLARGVRSKTSALDNVVSLLRGIQQPAQTKCILILCGYTGELLLLGISQKSEDHCESLQPVTDYYFKKKSKVQMQAFHFSVELCDLIHQALSFDAMEKYVQNSDDSPLCLQLWQDLLLLQSISAQVEANLEDAMDDEDSNGSKKMFEHCKDHIEESLTSLQHCLPVPVFLASVTSLILDEENGSLRTRALRFLVERANDIDPRSPEASLFLDLLPQVVELSQSAKTDDEGMMLQQAASIVTEHFARKLSPSTTSATTQHFVKPFLDALKHYTSRLEELSAETSDSSLPIGQQTMACQLACTLALCIASLVRLLKARCLPILPQMIGGTLSFLASASSDISSDDIALRMQSKLIQVSMLRAMTAIVQNLAQFLIPHLDKILSPSLLPLFDAEGVDLLATIAKQVPSRQLLPATSRALKKCSSKHELLALLKLTKLSVTAAARGEIGAIKSHVIQAILHGCEFDSSMIDFANEVLLALVMKLSEAQLRPLYAKLREWRGDDDVSRKNAFWSMSSVLSKELKSIFLPCLSTVTNDALQELEYAVSLLCVERKAKKAKLGSVESLQYLPPLVTCLANCFAADAREGGSWVREDGDERYHSFMGPLSKLLMAKVPSDFPFTMVVKDSYQTLIVYDGGVISSLVSLASAAGHENLWKPLNHAVLEACGDEDRAEVRQAGLTCLLKLIQTLGEEYMVLLPECLPVLSELLEADEGTASLARDCVDLSEELLGESLEDSLK